MAKICLRPQNTNQTETKSVKMTVLLQPQGFKDTQTRKTNTNCLKPLLRLYLSFNFNFTLFCNYNISIKKKKRYIYKGRDTVLCDKSLRHVALTCCRNKSARVMSLRSAARIQTGLNSYDILQRQNKHKQQACRSRSADEVTCRCDVLQQFVAQCASAFALRPYPHVSGYFRIRNFFVPDSKISPSTRSVFKSYSPVHTYPMVSGFTLVPKAPLH